MAESVTTGTSRHPWGRAAQYLVDRIADLDGEEGIERAIRDVNAEVLRRLPSGMLAACLFQASVTGARWNRYGVEHPLPLVAIASLAAILVAARLAYRRSLPPRAAQPVWAATVILVLLNTLFHQIWEFDGSSGVVRAGAIAAMVGASFLLFDFFWFIPVMAAGLSVGAVGIAANGGSTEALFGFALSVVAVLVAWAIRSDAIADLLTRRISELGETEPKKPFVATTSQDRTVSPDHGGQATPGLLIYDLGQVVDCNQALLTLAGRSADELSRLDVGELFVERDQRIVAAELAYPSEKPVEVSILTPGGEQVSVRLTAHALDWRGRKMTLVSLSDVRSENAWRIQAETDPLTELPNRLRLRRELNQALQGFTTNPSRTFAVFYLDLEDFKEINDTYGHAAGDEALRAVARRLTHVVRPGDIAARLGGDEFAILVQGIASLAAVDGVSARIRREIEQPIEYGGRTLRYTISLGAAVVGDGDGEADGILERADRAMYADKHRRRASLARDEAEAEEGDSGRESAGAAG